MKNFILFYSTLLLCLYSTSLFGQHVVANWTNTTSGTLNGVAFTVTGFTGSAISSFDLSGSDYSAAPQGAAEDIITYEENSTWTVNFTSPIPNLRVYPASWRGSVGNTDGNFNIASSGLASGNNLIVAGANVDVVTNFANGIIEFPGSVSSLTFTPSAGSSSAVGLTFGTGTTPLIAVSGGDIPTLSEWGLIVLALLLMTLGTLYLLQPSIRNNIERE